jgi:hypothetical protein
MVSARARHNVRVRWAAFEASAPELAKLGMDGFRERNLCLVGTLRADGWPRISASEIYTDLLAVPTYNHAVIETTESR